MVTQFIALVYRAAVTTMKPDFVRQDGAGWYGTFDDVQFQCYCTPADAKLLRERQALEMDFIHRVRPRQIIACTIVHEPAIVPLDQERRNAVTEHTRASAPFTRAGMLVLIAPGFKAAFIRGIVASLTLVTGAGFPFKVGATEDEAFDWVVPHLDKQMSKADLIGAYQALRALYKT